MSKRRGKLSPTLMRIVTLSVLLTLVAQAVLVYIGLTYAHSIDKSMKDKRTEYVVNQFQQNVLDQLNDINNLLLLLQTPEFSDFFKNKMNLRDDQTVSREKHKLLNKVKGLNISPDFVTAVHFIGADINEQSYDKKTNISSFEELPRLRMETLTESKLVNLFLPDHDQFTLYTDAEFNTVFRTDNRLLSVEDIEGLKSFISNIKGHLILTNGNKNGVFIVIVLSDHFFERSLPPSRSDASSSIFSVMGRNNRILWSSGKSAADDGSFTNTVKELQPFQLRMVYSEKQPARYRINSILLLKMTGLSLLTLFITVFISFFYLKKVFQPFRVIAKELKNQALTEEMALRAIPEDLIKKGFQAISMRNKLIIILIAAVSIPTLSDGVLYSRFLNRDVRPKMEASMNAMGDFSVVSVGNRVRFVENTLNDISVSQNFQDFINDRYFFNKYSNDSINLSMFPGLSEVSYFVLLDNSGNCVYSSIFSGNKGIFNTDAKNLLSRNDPYWMSDYKDVFNDNSTAIVKRIGPNNVENTTTYLLMVPKESIFKIDSSLFNAASYVISDNKGQTIYRSRSFINLNSYKVLHYTKKIPATNWNMSIDYVFNEVIDKNRVYEEQFLLVMFIVFLLSLAAAFMIADILVKPVKQLKETMLAVGEGDFARKVSYYEDNEIGGIIRSYNRMIGQLDQTIRQNMNIMAENAQNKIRENELISMKARAELHMLQAQINPHFLYNTLEAINMKSMKSGNHEISAIVSALADLFRYSISKGTDVVELEKELNHVNNYMTIQKIRFGHSFRVEYDVPAELKGTSTLRFILQPIVENSIKHGFTGWETGGLIRISALQIDERLQLNISDNGVGMSREALLRLTTEMELQPVERRREDSGIGLKNVHRRLKLFYKEGMSMTVDSALMRGTVVTLEFPLSVENTLEIP
jgi:two-component system sensor histidine kinase YesM